MVFHCYNCPHKDDEDKNCPCVEKTVKDIIKLGNKAKVRNDTDINFFMAERHHKRHRRYKESR